MLRITRVYEDENSTRLKVDGQIIDPCFLELEYLCRHYVKVKVKEVILDFEGVSYIDDKGMTMLEKFKDEKIIILNSSPFIKSLLNLNETSYVG